LFRGIQNFKYIYEKFAKTKATSPLVYYCASPSSYAPMQHTIIVETTHKTPKLHVRQGYQIIQVI